MKRRLISAALSAPLLAMVFASAVLADHGGSEEDVGLFSSESKFPPLATSVLLGTICYALMVRDPERDRKASRPRPRY